MAKTQNNILLILADQWRGDCLGAVGHPVVETPGLDELAGEGVLFRRAYSPSPSCIPARACLATGMQPWNCGRIGYLDKVPWEYRQTMMSLLRDNGYQTINVGKTHFFPQRACLGFEVNKLYDPQRLSPGFQSDYHRWLQDQKAMEVYDPAMVADNNTWIVSPWDGPAGLHPTEWTARTAIDTLSDRDPQRPFFMQIGFHRPHPPYDPPSFYFEQYRDIFLPSVPIGTWQREDPIHPYEDWRANAFFARLKPEMLDRMRRAYFAAITHIDAQIAKIIHYLKLQQLYDSTTILFSSDHGELLGDHHMYRKVSPFEGSASIPMIIKPAAGIPYKKRYIDSRTPVSLIDIMPTVLDHAGIPVPKDVDGLSLQPALEGMGLSRGMLHGEHAAIEGVGWQFIVDGRYKYIWETVSGREWFFDLQIDPQEEKNLVGEIAYQDKVTVFRDHLIALLNGRPGSLSDGVRLIPGTAMPPLVSMLDT